VLDEILGVIGGAAASRSAAKFHKVDRHDLSDIHSQITGELQ
jgi:hypothetical protein